MGTNLCEILSFRPPDFHSSLYRLQDILQQISSWMTKLGFSSRNFKKKLTSEISLESLVVEPSLLHRPKYGMIYPFLSDTHHH